MTHPRLALVSAGVALVTLVGVALAAELHVGHPASEPDPARIARSLGAAVAAAALIGAAAHRYGMAGVLVAPAALAAALAAGTLTFDWILAYSPILPLPGFPATAAVWESLRPGSGAYVVFALILVIPPVLLDLLLNGLVFVLDLLLTALAAAAVAGATAGLPVYGLERARRRRLARGAAGASARSAAPASSRADYRG